MVRLMSTSSPTDDTQQSADPAAAIAAATAATGSPATVALTKTPEGFGPAAPQASNGTPAAGAAGAWAPRPHEQLSPEQKAVEDLTDEELEALTQGNTSKGVLGGAFAIAGAGVGLIALSGSWLSTTIYQRQGLIGSIAANGKASAVIIKDEYTTPWEHVLYINGAFAAVGLLIGIGVLFCGRFLASKPLPNWVKAVAWGAVALGVIGLGVAGFTHYEVLNHVITVPASAATSSSGS
jgi:hypothetical protein